MSISVLSRESSRFNQHWEQVVCAVARCNVNKCIKSPAICNTDGSVPPAAKLIVANCPDIRLMPQLAVTLMRYLTIDPLDIPLPQLATDIARDPRAIAELLRFTNSSALGLRRQVSKVADAVNILGPRRAILLIFAGSAIASSMEMTSRWSEPTRIWFYRRCALTAGAARVFGRLERVSPGLAFLLGLVQDLGMLAMAKTLGDCYRALLGQSLEAEIHVAERAEFGVTHAEVTAALLEKWGFGQSFIEPVLNHHSPDSAVSLDAAGLAYAMQISEAIADMCDRPCSMLQERVDRLLTRYGSAGKEAYPLAVSGAISQTDETMRMLSFPRPELETFRKAEELLATARNGLSRPFGQNRRLSPSLSPPLET